MEKLRVSPFRLLALLFLCFFWAVSGVLDVSAGSEHTCLLLNCGSVTCFGSGAHGNTGGTNGTTWVELGSLGHRRVKQLSSSLFTCLVLNDGAARCFGRGGALGDGRFSASTGDLGPSYQSDLSIYASHGPVSSLATGGTTDHPFACAVTFPEYDPSLSDTNTIVGDVHSGGRGGSLLCWGSPHNGRLASGSNASVGNVPSDAYFNYSHANATFGNDYPSLPMSSMEAVKLPAGAGNVTRVSLGRDHGCALFGNGTVRCWGDGSSGQLGGVSPGNPGAGSPGLRDTPPIPFTFPVLTSISDMAAVAVSCGGAFTCVLFGTGGVRCFGDNAHGQLGLDHAISLGSSPGDIENLGDIGFAADGAVAVQIDAGANHTCAVFDNGRVRCWGMGDSGRLGSGAEEDIGDETGEMAGLGYISFANATILATRVSTGDKHTCALFENLFVRCWGSHLDGRLGTYGGAFPIASPTEPIGDAPGEMSQLPFVNTGLDHIACPARGNIDPGRRFSTAGVVAARHHTCARMTCASGSSKLACFGDHSQGRLGSGTVVGNVGDDPGEIETLPGVAFPGTDVVIQTSSVWVHTCSLFSNGRVRCFGFDNVGRLGYDKAEMIGDEPGEVESLPYISFAEPTILAVQASAGGTHSCVLFSNGGVRCFGSASNGKIGSGNTTDIGDEPGEMSSLGFIAFAEPTVVAVQVSSLAHNCVLFSNGGVRCFGAGTFGRLGTGSTLSVGASPLDMLTLDFISFGNASIVATQVSAGNQHTCVLFANGGVRCFGNGGGGRTGIDSSDDMGDEPGEMENLPFIRFGAPGRDVVIQVVAGHFHSCAVFANGGVRCWGNGSGGRLGTGSTANVGDGVGLNMTSVVDISFGTAATRATQVALGVDYTCVQMEDTSVRCFGEADGGNGHGRLGSGGTDDVGDNPGEMETLSPVQFVMACPRFSDHDPGAGSTSTGIATGNAHTCARLSCGEIVCFGTGSYGRLGYGNQKTVGDAAIAERVPLTTTGTEKVAQVALNMRANCVLFTNGGLKCFGAGGNLGNGGTDNIGDDANEVSKVTFIEFSDTAVPVIQIASGMAHHCALFANGGVRCFGHGLYGKLGTDNENTIGDSPGEMSSLPYITFATPNVRAAQVTAGRHHTCVLFTNGGVRCFGDGTRGALGTGSTDSVGKGPGDMATLPFIDFGDGGSASVHFATQVSSGEYHTCVLFASGRVKCFGAGESGQLGTGSIADIGGSPGDIAALDYVPFGTDHVATQVTCGHTHTCAVFHLGGVRCWGSGIAIGAGTNETLGDEPGEMTAIGFIPFADPGDMPTHVTAGNGVTCVRFESGRMRCLGTSKPSLGYEPSEAIGDVGDQEGEVSQLPYLPLFSQCPPPSESDMGSALSMGVSTGSFTCVRFPCGGVTCIGRADEGRVGSGDVVQNIGDDPNEVAAARLLPFAGTDSATQISSSRHHTCVLFSNGGVRCFGRGSFGQLGTGSPQHIGDNPGEIESLGYLPFPEPTVVAVQVAAGGVHSCVLFSNGRVRCFGKGEFGEMGTGTPNIGSSPGDIETLDYVQFAQPTILATQVSTGDDTTCVLFTNGGVRCWGDGSDGRLGTDSTASVGDVNGALLSDLPFVQVGSALHRVSQLSTRSNHVCVLLVSGGVTCWGSGGNGTLGTDDTRNVGDGVGGRMADVTPIAFNTTDLATQVSIGRHHSCALFANGGVRCWGRGSAGQLGSDNTDNIGDGSGMAMSLLPFIAFADPTLNATQVSVGEFHTCILFEDESVRCFGHGDQGRLGTGAVDHVGDNPGEMVTLPAISFGEKCAAVPSTVGFSVTADAEVYQAIGAFLFEVERFGSGSGAFIVAVDVVPGTAVPGVDYNDTAIPTSLLFETGDTRKDIIVPLFPAPLSGTVGLKVSLTAVTHLGVIANVTIDPARANRTLLIVRPLETPLAPLASVSTFAATGSVVVTWSLAPPSAPAVTGYELFRGGSSIAVLAGAGTMSFTDAGRSENTSYTYTVRYNTSFAWSPVSSGVSVTTHFRDPSLGALSPTSVPVALGGSVTVTGAHFGAASPGAVSYVTIGGGTSAAANASSVTWESATRIVVTVPPVLPLGSPAVAGVTMQVYTIYGGVSNTLTFDYMPAPNVTLVSPVTSGRIEAAMVSVWGHGMGVAAADVTSVTLAGVPCVNVTWHNASSIECAAGIAPVGGQTSGPVVVTTASAGGSGGGSTMFAYTAPVVTAIEPASGPVTGGTTVTLHGVNLGLTAADDLAEVNITASIPCASYSRVSGVEVICVTPSVAATAVSAVPLPVSVRTQTGGVFTTTQPPVGFMFTAAPPGPGGSFGPPVITSVSPLAGPTSGGTVVTIRGTQLGVDAADLTSVTVAGLPCALVAYESPALVRCTTPTVTTLAVAGPVVLTTNSSGGIAATSTEMFSYYEPSAVVPTVTSLVPSTGSTRGGYVVSIYGVGFGSVPSDVSGVVVGTRSATEVVFHDSTFVECTFPAGTPGPSAVTVLPAASTTAAGAVPLDFNYIYPAPTLNNARPRLVSSLGGTKVTFRGENFGATNPGSLVILIGSVPCLAPAWISETEVTCVTPSMPTDGTPIVDVPITVVVNGVASESTTLAVLTGTKGFRYGAVDCNADCGYNNVCNDATGTCDSCSPGFAGPTCEDRLVRLVPPTTSTTTATATLKNSAVDVVVREPANPVDDTSTAGSVTVNAVLATPLGAETVFAVDVELLGPTGPRDVVATPETLTIPAGQLSAPITIAALQDTLSDFDRTSRVSLRAVSGPASVTGAPIATLPSLVVLTVDPDPSITSVLPTAVPLAGRVNLTITGDHWDEWIQVFVDGTRVGEFRTVRGSVGTPPPPGVGSVALRSGTAATRMAAVEGEGSMSSSSSSLLSSRSSRSGSTGNTTAAGSGRSLFSSVGAKAVFTPTAGDFGEVEGYRKLTIVNVVAKTSASDSTLLYTTKDCPNPGEFGIGSACEPCPKGGICPGGFRIWPEPGYWNPDEGSGFVQRCDPPEACVGTRDRLCAPGYEGHMCGKCSVDHHRANGICAPCPQAESTLVFIVGDVLVWLLLAVAAVTVRDRMTLSYIVMTIRALSMLGAVGKMTEGREIPQWIITIYEILYMFSGDYSFVKPDCVTPAPFAQIFGISIAYNVGIFLPVFLAIGFMWLMSSADGPSDYDETDGSGAGSAARKYPYLDDEGRTVLRPRTRSYWDDRAVRMCVIWGSVVYLSLTSLAMEALSCVRDADGTHRMITRRSEVCYVGAHAAVTAAACVLLIAFTCGYPMSMLNWVKREDHADLLHSDERFMERWNYLYEFYNVKNPTFWLIEFPITCIVAAGNSILKPHVNYQMSISVAVFLYKLLYIVFRRPFIDWITDIIQAVLALVSLIVINMTFFSRHGVFEKVPGLSVSFSVIVAVILAAAIVSMVSMVVWLLVRPQGEAEFERQEKAVMSHARAEKEIDGEEVVGIGFVRGDGETDVSEEGKDDNDSDNDIDNGICGKPEGEEEEEGKGFVAGLTELFTALFGGGGDPEPGNERDGQGGDIGDGNVGNVEEDANQGEMISPRV